MKKLILLALLTGCASDDWTREDTAAEIAWQVMNIVDAGQTSNIQHIPELQEIDPLTSSIIGRQPSSSDTYQLMATYAISHYIVSRTLPKGWRKFWFGATNLTKASVIIENRNIGL